MTEDHVRAALLTDKGSAAELTSWTVADFTNKGDNYMSVVTKIKVIFTLQGKEQKTSYVAKISDERLSGGYSDVIKFMSMSEVRFFEDLVPALNNELAAAGQSSLRVPRCFYTCCKGGWMLLILEDLLSKGFKMYSRHQGLDVAHTRLVLQELGRLHAASLLLQARTPYNPLHHKYPYLATKWYSVTKEANEIYKKFLLGSTDCIILTLEKIGGYSSAIKWLQDVKPQIADALDDDLESPSPFIVLCHGDVWTNNFLFRYDECGRPVEVRLLDLQLNMLGSLATDLNFFLFTSVEGPVRRRNTDIFMDTYYNALRKVMEAAHLSLPFTPQDLSQEYRDKHTHGVICSCWAVPTVIAEVDDSPDFDELTDEKIKLFMEKRKHSLLHHLIKSPFLKPRLLDGFDELKECGIIKE